MLLYTTEVVLLRGTRMSGRQPTAGPWATQRHGRQSDEKENSRCQKYSCPFVLWYIIFSLYLHRYSNRVSFDVQSLFRRKAAIFQNKEVDWAVLVYCVSTNIRARLISMLSLLGCLLLPLRKVYLLNWARSLNQANHELLYFQRILPFSYCIGVLGFFGLLVTYLHHHGIVRDYPWTKTNDRSSGKGSEQKIFWYIYP